MFIEFNTRLGVLTTELEFGTLGRAEKIDDLTVAFTTPGYVVLVKATGDALTIDLYLVEGRAIGGSIIPTILHFWNRMFSYSLWERTKLGGNQ